MINFKPFLVIYCNLKENKTHYKISNFLTVNTNPSPPPIAAYLPVCTRGLSRATSAHKETSAERDQWRELPDERGQRGTSGDQRGARPVARATGRARPARNERARRSETSGASYRTSEASAERAETSAERDQWRELPDERGQRFRATSASRSESVIRGGARGASARGESQTLGGARYERCEGVRGRPNAAGRLAQKLPSPALKEAERFGILQSGRFEHPYGGNCTAGTVQGQQAGRATRAAPCESTLT